MITHLATSLGNAYQARSALPHPRGGYPVAVKRWEQTPSNLLHDHNRTIGAVEDLLSLAGEQVVLDFVGLEGSHGQQIDTALR